MSFPLMPNVVQTVPTPTVSYVTLGSSNQGGTFTVPSPTSADRYIIYVTSNQVSSVSLTSCTIGGVPADVASSGNASFACARVPTGTSVTITTTYASGGGTSSSHIGFVYVAYGLESTIWRTAVFNAGNPSSSTVTVPEGGLIFAPVQVDNDNQSTTFAAGMVRDANGNNGASRGYAAAHHNAFASSQSYTVTCAIGTPNGLGCYTGVGVLR